MASANAGFLGGAGMMEGPAVRAPFHLGTLVLFKFSAELTLFIIKKRVDSVILVKIQQRAGNQGGPGWEVGLAGKGGCSVRRWVAGHVVVPVLSGMEA